MDLLRLTKPCLDSKSMSRSTLGNPRLASKVMTLLDGPDDELPDVAVLMRSLPQGASLRQFLAEDFGAYREAAG